MRPTLLALLVRLREARLKEEAARLKLAANKLDGVRRRQDEARSSAALAIESAQNLRELAAAGNARIQAAKQALVAVAEMEHLTQRVGRSRKLAEGAREAAAEAAHAASARRDEAIESESEQFLAWTKVHRR
jgi:hypothetical protein